MHPGPMVRGHGNSNRSRGFTPGRDRRTVHNGVYVRMAVMTCAWGWHLKKQSLNIRGGHVIDPAQKPDGLYDILLKRRAGC